MESENLLCTNIKSRNYSVHSQENNIVFTTRSFSSIFLLVHVCLFLTPRIRKITITSFWHTTTKPDISLAFFVRLRKKRPLSSINILYGILLAKITTSINYGYMLEEAVGSRPIAEFWNLSCSPVGAEVFPNKKQESDFNTMLDCSHFFSAFARHLCLFLEMKGKLVLMPFFSSTFQPNCICTSSPFLLFIFLSPSSSSSNSISSNSWSLFSLWHSLHPLSLISLTWVN